MDQPYWSCGVFRALPSRWNHPATKTLVPRPVLGFIQPLHGESQRNSMAEIPNPKTVTGPFCSQLMRKTAILMDTTEFDSFPWETNPREQFPEVDTCIASPRQARMEIPPVPTGRLPLPVSELVEDPRSLGFTSRNPSRTAPA